ncbi:hypothetical protein [Microvirga pakistanensis]|uniref:hypothetical protein n=1 Tax=Microvirga pakistanensis TaxID=1682650 RepID=UPI0010693F32|nr:hypothetical protein [Microvirga pakistanensis]
MSETFSYYVIDERKLSRNGDGLSDRQRFERLIAEVKRWGALWAQIELDELTFMYALEAIDAHVGGEKFIPVLTFNNSPGNVLGNDPGTSSIGYFNPEQAADLDFVVSDLSGEEIDDPRVDQEIIENVLHAIQLSSREAAKRGHALAVLHG